MRVTCPLLRRGPPIICRVVRCRTVEEETSAAGVRGEALRHALAAEDTAAAAALYVLLRAADRFHAAHQRFPGVYDRWAAGAGGGWLAAGAVPRERRAGVLLPLGQN